MCGGEGILGEYVSCFDDHGSDSPGRRLKGRSGWVNLGNLMLARLRHLFYQHGEEQGGGWRICGKG